MLCIFTVNKIERIFGDYQHGFDFEKNICESRIIKRECKLLCVEGRSNCLYKEINLHSIAVIFMRSVLGRNVKLKKTVKDFKQEKGCLKR